MRKLQLKQFLLSIVVAAVIVAAGWVVIGIINELGNSKVGLPWRSLPRLELFWIFSPILALGAQWVSYKKRQKVMTLAFGFVCLFLISVPLFWFGIYGRGLWEFDALWVMALSIFLMLLALGVLNAMVRTFRW